MANFRTGVIVVWLMALSGCSSIPIMSMVKLSGFSPFEADPGQIQIAVRAPDAIRLKKGDVKMELKYQAEDNSLSIHDIYLIEVIPDPGIYPELHDDKKRSEAVTLFALSPADVQQMRDTQKILNQYKQMDKKGQGSFGIGISDVCLTKPLPESGVEVDIFIQTQRDDTFFVLNENLPLLQHIGIEEHKKHQWPACE